MLLELQNYRELVDCEGLINHDIDAIRRAKTWTFNITDVSSGMHAAADRKDVGLYIDAFTYYILVPFWWRFTTQDESGDGGFNSWVVRQKLEQVFGTVAYARGRTEFGLYQPEKYYISRFQTWSYGFMPCYGKNVRGSCCYGVRDVPGLLARPELVAHKFSLDFQPAAFFCTYEAVRKRSFHPNFDFDARNYADLPGPRMLAGKSVTVVRSPTGLNFF
uniref:DUF2612 domain-containing protein n=1 Tax=Steinernema glaseri TaxID=37863 RepID=A0A1I7Z7Q4_9BILA